MATTTKINKLADKPRKQFSIGTISDPVFFNIDDDEFEAIPANRLPAGALAKYFAAINDSRVFDAHEFFFTSVLTEESYKLFEERLHSAEKPITIGIMGDIAAWLLGEVYLQGEVTSS